MGHGERLGDLIRRARGGRSQAWLSAQLIGLGLRLDQGAVSDIELGRRELEMKEVAAFAQALDLTVEEVVGALATEYRSAREASRDTRGSPVRRRRSVSLGSSRAGLAEMVPSRVKRSMNASERKQAPPPVRDKAQASGGTSGRG